jgi:hypothetical protein
MTVIVNSGSTLVVTSQGLTLTADSTIAVGGLLQGTGVISGAFELLNLGLITGMSGALTIDSGAFDNQGVVEATTGVGGSVTIGASVDLLDATSGTLTAGTWYSFGGVISLPGAQITQDDATIDLNGGTLIAGATSVLTSLTSIGATGALSLSAMGQSSLSGPFVDSGLLSSSFTDLSVPGGLTVTSGGTLMLQFGSFTGALTLDGLLEMLSGEATNLPGNITGTGTIQVDYGAEVPIIGPATVSQTLINNGNITLQNTNAATGVTIATAPSGTGEIDVLAGTLELAGGSGNAISYDYGSNKAAIVLDNPAAFAAEILGMNNTIDAVVLNGIIGDTATLNGGLLSVMNGAGTVATLNLMPLPAERLGPDGQNYASATFTATPNVAANNTTITVTGVTATSVCFCSGTRIATPSGPVAVEHLAVGDRVLTHSGGVRRVIWSGQRTISFRDGAAPADLWPVRIAPDAFGADQPCRDLFLSPDHAVFVDEVLIPVRYLINGTTIRQIAVGRVTYHHIELEEHDIVLAEGLAAESYLDSGDRGFFVGGGAPAALFPNFAVRTWEMAGCAPLVVTGRELAKVRAMLAGRAGRVVLAAA